MDLPGLAMVIGIPTWAWFEYRRREQLHKENMAYLGRGERPPDRTPAPEAWKLVTSATVALARVGVVVLFSILAQHNGRVNPAIVTLAVIFFALFLLVVRMFIHDLRIYRAHSRSHRKATP